MTATKRIKPTVGPKEVIDTSGVIVQQEGVAEGEDENAWEEVSLPPISHVKPPDMKHTSTKIRWYCGLGYTIKEVSNLLGVRYQQVRNVATTAPKRAAREDVPPLRIELFELDDDLEAMDKHAMEQEMAIQRREHRKEARDMRRKRRETVDD